MGKPYYRGYKKQGRGWLARRKPRAQKKLRSPLVTQFDTPRISPAGVPYVRIKDPMMGIMRTNELEKLAGRSLPFTHTLLWRLNNL